MTQRILVVEDEPAIAESVAYALRRDHFTVTIASTARDAEREVAGMDLVVLDLMLPDSSGFDLIAEFRERGSKTPIIVLSSRDDEADRVAALEAGADDYVTKPFSPREVVARVRAVLRRVEMPATPPPRDFPVRVDLGERRAFVVDREVELTRVEFDLLACLLQQPGRVFTRAQLIDRVWGDGYAITDRTVDSHVKSLRRKVGDGGAGPAVIETVRGVGFRIASDSEPEPPE
jgi:two-component system catabolic regulation response regulator CreB